LLQQILQPFPYTTLFRSEGMIEGQIERLEKGDVGNIIHRGGTFLKTARSEGFRTPEGRRQAFESLKAHDIDALVAIGGDGTFTGDRKSTRLNSSHVKISY